jgi:arylformamidase
MAFDSLLPQPPMDLASEAYSRAALELSRLAAMTSRCRLDVAYGDGPLQKLDIYLPEHDSTGLPILLYFHGGGFTHGYKEWMGLSAAPIVAAPAVFISASYQLAPFDQHPVHLNDCLRALAWVHRNAGSFGGSAGRIFIGGHSAGAMLAAHLALRKDLYTQHGLPEDVVKGCFPTSGTYDMRDPTVYGEPPPPPPSVHADRQTAEAKSIVAAISANPELARNLSAISFAAGNRTPFFVAWAERDSQMCKSTSSAFVLALREQPRAIVEAHMFPRFDHFWVHLDQQVPDNLWAGTVKAWMSGKPGPIRVSAAGGGGLPPQLAKA